jgi:hypothetical protein
MSDEPSPLRLRPRLKSEDDSGTSAAEEGSAVSAQPAEETGLKIRLRPKLALQPEEAPPEPTVPHEVADESVEAPLSTEEATVADGPKFRLKTRSGGAISDPLPPLPVDFAIPALTPDPMLSEPSAGLRFGAAGDPSSSVTGAASPLYVPTVETPAVTSYPPPPASRQLPPSQRKIFKIGVIGTMGAVVLILVCGFFFFRRVMNQQIPVNHGVKSKSRLKSVPSTPDSETATARSTKAATKAPVPTPVELVGADPGEPKPAPAHVSTSVEPGIVATSTSDAVLTVNASSQFRSWVANVKISGVNQGATPRALINGRMVQLGQIVDEAQGIEFDSVDPHNKTIVFKDRTGAVVSRRY